MDKDAKFVLDALRRASLRWQPRTKAKQAARVARNRYKCKGCEGIFPNKQVSVDHVAPVVDPETGFVDWNTYVARLFVPVESLQILCSECHSRKSKGENLRRREVVGNNPKERKPRPRRRKK